MSDKIRFAYSGLDQIILPRDERSYYLHFIVRVHGIVILDFYTNKDFEGWFTKDIDYGTYHQWKGTCQFILKHSNVESARRHLRKIAMSRLYEN